jgi:hypothetical protein
MHGPVISSLTRGRIGQKSSLLMLRSSLFKIIKKLYDNADHMSMSSILKKNQDIHEARLDH